MICLVVRPPLFGPFHNSNDVSAFPGKSEARHAAEVLINRLKIGIGVAHNGLAQIIDAVTNMAGLRMMTGYDAVYSRPVTMTNGVLVGTIVSESMNEAQSDECENSQGSGAGDRLRGHVAQARSLDAAQIHGQLM